MTQTSNVAEATASNIQQLIAQADAAARPVFLDFYAPWCEPCKRMKPVIEQLATDHPDVAFIAVNIDECPDFSLKHGIRSVPTFKLVHKGMTQGTLIGTQLKQRLAELLS